jgi:hypothetical protein
VVPNVESVNSPYGRADGFYAKVASSQNGRDREFAGEAAVAELVLECTDRHVGELANGVVDDFVARFVEFLARHTEKMAGAERGELRAQVEVDQPIDVANEPHSADDLLAFDFDGTTGGVSGLALAVEDGVLIEHRFHDVLDSAVDGLAEYHLTDTFDRRHDNKGKRQRMLPPRVLSTGSAVI